MAPQRHESSHGRAGSVRFEDHPLGEYLIDLFVTRTEGGEVTVDSFEITLSSARSMRLLLDNAIDSLCDRIARDAAAGDCGVCSNTRMIDVERFGRLSHQAEHCPECTPKIVAVDDRVRNPKAAH